MFEVIIAGLIAFAVGYVGLMRLMARRADVLYGGFLPPERAPTDTAGRRAV